MLRHQLILAVCASAALPGCQNTPIAPAAAARPATTDFVSTQPVALQPYFLQLYGEGERNAVLNFDRLGVAALAEHQYEIAKKAFDQAIVRIDAFRTSGSDLNAAKSKFQNEASKDFKGEPYERGMNFYYRGLLYLHDGDFANAGASFARVNVEDSQADGEHYKADYASMKFLNAWTLGCQNERSTSADLSSQATAIRSEMQELNYQQPLMVIVETGSAPQKIGTGQYQEKLSWESAADDRSRVGVTVGASAAPAPVRAESLYFQATTRGGRPVEYLLAGKARFKDVAGTTADVSSAVALGAMQVANIQAASGQYGQALTSDYVAMGSAVFSMFSKIAQNSTKPAADTRTWESVPGTLWMTTAAAAPTGVDSDIAATVNGQTRRPDMTGSFGACRMAWFRTADVPASKADPAERIDTTPESRARLKTFQAKLAAMF